MTPQEPQSLQTGSVLSPGLGSGEDHQLNFRMLLKNVVRRRAVVAVCTLLGLALGITAALLPRHYSASSKIQVRPGSSSQYKVDASELLSNMGDDSTKLDTEVLVLQSDTLLLDTADKLHLQTDAAFMKPPAKGDDPNSPRSQEALLAALHKNISVTRIPRTQIMVISCNTKSPLLSARVVNTLVAEYIERLFESRFSSTQRVTKWLSGQLDDLKQQVEADQEKLIQLQSRLGVVGLDQNHDIVVSELEDLTKAADEARIQRIIAEARYRILSSGDMNLLEGGQDILEKSSPSSSQLALLANLRNQKATVEARYSGLSAQFGPRYPEVKQAAAELTTLNSEIQQEQKRVLNQAQQAYNASASNEQNTVATLESKKSQAFQKQSDMVQYQILLHDYESSRTLYEGLMQRLRQAGIVAGLDSSEVDVVDMARVPGRPSETRRSVTVLLGLLFGLALGVVAVVVFSQLDQRLHDLSAIETQLHLPLIAISPRLGKTELGNAIKKQPGGSLDHISDVFLHQPRSPFVESMWSLRNSLLLSNPGHAPKVIMFTSCNPGEGKSTMASGQACALALRNARVLLIDADMRHPTLMRRLNLTNSVGLSSILTGRASTTDAIQSVPGIPNLAVITSGPIPPSPPLILGSENMSALIATLSSGYDFVVIDTPPLLGLGDASIIAQFAQAIVLVVSFDNLNRAQVLRARKTLAQVGRAITGVALNFADPESLGDYGYGYGYGSPVDPKGNAEGATL
jgi:capsular exopolysaccharide synthesis family protein